MARIWTATAAGASRLRYGVQAIARAVGSRRSRHCLLALLASLASPPSAEETRRYERDEQPERQRLHQRHPGVDHRVLVHLGELLQLRGLRVELRLRRALLARLRHL